jgi:hypothetical protein
LRATNPPAGSKNHSEGATIPESSPHHLTHNLIIHRIYIHSKIFKNYFKTRSADGKIIVDKEYLGQHTVRHTGALTHTGDATVAKGSWSVPNTRAVGGFMMTERVNMRRGVPEVFTTALGTVGQPVIVTSKCIIYYYSYIF